jgi:hypothetical protein
VLLQQVAADLLEQYKEKFSGGALAVSFNGPFLLVVAVLFHDNSCEGDSTVLLKQVAAVLLEQYKEERLP